jgi:spermidine synthase
VRVLATEANPATRAAIVAAAPKTSGASATVAAAVPFLLFFSGAAGLIYQVAWVRLLGLTFGVTIFAISTVLAAFMGGLAIGSFVGGRRADRLQRPLQMYGLVELGVGLTALITPWAFSQLQNAYAELAQVVDPAQAPLIAGTVRAVLAFAVLLVPTALMGATLPLAVRGVRGLQHDHDPTRGDAWTMGLLYAANTTGAIVGCLLCGFVLIGQFGLSGTIVVAAIANAVAGVGGLLMGYQPLTSSSSSAASTARRAREVATSSDAALARTALVAFGISGAISLAYEVVWARILAVLFDSSIYGFVLMLATVLAGIAVGGAAGGLLVRWQVGPRVAGIAFGALEIGIGLAAVLALVAFGGAYEMLLAIRNEGPDVLVRFVRTELRLMTVLCVVTVLPAALLMGATFPVAARLWAAGASGLGRRLGGVYAANVAGAIGGSLLSGFVLVPLIGAHHSLLLLAAANVVLGVVLLLVARQRWLAAVGGVVALALVAWGATWPPLHYFVFNQHFPDQQLLAYWEGLENTVTVGRDPDGVHTLFTNSRGQTNDTPDLVRYHRAMGHLAALLAPRSDAQVLVVGLGGGATPGAIARHSGTHIDIIELSESVIAAAPWFSVASDDVLHQPNVRLSVDDGRNYLLRNRRAYDVITADVVPPYDAGATNLYSVEYFSLVARSLAPNGIMVQWVSPGSAFEHSLIVRTFLQAFPNATLWLTGDLLVGSPNPIRLSRAELERRLADPSARAALAEVGFNRAQDVLAQFRGTTEQLHAYAGPGAVLTDDHPILEYFQTQDIPGGPPDLEQFHAAPPVVD